MRGMVVLSLCWGASETRKAVQGCIGFSAEIDGDAFLIQGEPVRDRERLVWTVDLRPA